MCGRFTNKLTWDEIVRLYRLTIKAPPHNLPPRYNICPTDPVDVVTERDGNRDHCDRQAALVLHPRRWRAYDLEARGHGGGRCKRHGLCR